MTDNAKERLAAKLGLNKDALGVVTNMIALGVNIKTSILLVNHPTIRNYYFTAMNKNEPTDPGIRALVEDHITRMDKGDVANLAENIEVTDSILSEHILELSKAKEDSIITEQPLANE